MDGAIHATTVPQLIPGAQFLVAPTYESFYTSFKDGQCNVIAGESIDVAVPIVQSKGLMDTLNYLVTGNFCSSEPLAQVARNEDQ